MEKTEWTEEQLAAIENRDKTLLVSAAAGSGKTATLTERIIRSLTDTENPQNIDSLLVVTFTIAAASELRAKISKALTAAVAENPENKHLQRQLYLLPSAKIRTIDSFCNEILKQNCDRVGIPPNYRLADTAECELLAISIIEGLIESVYEGGLPDIASPEEFEELADCLTDTKRTEDLADVFRLIYAKCESAEEGIDSLVPLIAHYSENLPVEKTLYGGYLMKMARDTVDYYRGVMSKLIVGFSSGGTGEEKCLVTAEADLSMLEEFADIDTYDGMREKFQSYTFVKKASVSKAETTATTDAYAALREKLKNEFKKFKERFGYTSDMWQELFSSLSRLLSVLYRFEKRFDALFIEEKRRRGAISYADIERFAYKCLVDEGGAPTDIARNLSEKFSAIYIDEYQDVNSLQNKIFEVISRPRNRFMVGDIKQSIYCFRSARPEIFADMKNSYPPLSDTSADAASVFMSSNFRCDRAIVDFVNSVFDKAFSLVGESIGYARGDRLGYAKKQKRGEPEYIYPEICMLDKPGGDDDEDDISTTVLEAEVVAKKIEQLLAHGRLNSGEPIRPSDIAIIMRDAKGRADKYVDALAARGISSCISGAKDFFLSSEVLLALCLLNSIDNPRRDIYLAGLMCSPLFSFTPDELFLIRDGGRGTLYESLVAYVKANPDYAKGASFLKTLSYYRTISEGVGVDKLIYKLYHETGLMSLASKSGGRENLTVLYDYSRRFECGGFKGLYNFINFVNSLIDKKTTFDETRSGGDGDAVKVVTCHGSKGLEYPVVFLVESGKRIKNKDISQRLSFSENFGIAFRLRTPSGLALVDNPVKDIVNHRIFRKIFEEELRVLYVALTRARERLFIVGTALNKDRDEYIRKIGVFREYLTEYSLFSLASFLEIILATGDVAIPKDAGAFLADVPASEVSKSEECAPVLDEISEVESKNMPSEEEPHTPRETVHECDPELREELVRRFTYEYPDRYMTELPEKMSVSKTSPTVLDGTEDESAVLVKKERVRRKLPKFADGTDSDESAKRGIATHYFLQFCDLERLACGEAKDELARLVSAGYISAEDGERVRLDEIELFRRSELFSKMLGAKKLYREFRFNTRLPASEFTSEEARRQAYGDCEVLVQGVIDCIIVFDDGSIGLYDYKTDRLTKDELSDKSLAAATLKEKHKTQLSVYSLAAERIFGRSPERLEVYSLPLGDTVSMI